MKTGKRFAATALGGALILAATTSLSAAESWSETLMKPLAATSFDAGGAHVVSAFRNADGLCELTLTIADRTAAEATAPARLQLTVEPGRTARYDGADGSSSRFTCLGRAEAMALTKIDRVALRPDAQ
jgi:hypothetical protein